MSVRIAGIELNEDWRLIYALTQIKGIGWVSSKKILAVLKIDESKRVKDLSSDQVTKVSSELENFITEGDLAKRIRENLTRLKTIGSYRGIRHNRALPARGQRTRSNARTKRGKRRTVGSYKKDVLARQKQDTSTKKE